MGRLGLFTRMGKSRRVESDRRIERNVEANYVSAHSIAIVYVGLGEKDKAFEWLDKAFEERAESVGWLKLTSGSTLYAANRNSRRSGA
jgi:hypothetical protein